MGSLTPEHYKISKDIAEKYISEVEKYIEKKHAIFFDEDVQKQVAEGNRIIGRMEVMIDALKDGSDKKDDWERRKFQVEAAIKDIYKHHNLK